MHARLEDLVRDDRSRAHAPKLALARVPFHVERDEVDVEHPQVGRAGGHLQTLLDAPPLGDVGGEADGAPAARDRIGRHEGAIMDVAHRSIRPQEPVLAVDRLAGPEPLQVRLDLGEVVGMDGGHEGLRIVVDLRKRPSPDLLVGGADIAHAALVHLEDVEDLADGLGHLAEARLALAQLGLGSGALRRLPGALGRLADQGDLLGGPDARTGVGHEEEAPDPAIADERHVHRGLDAQRCVARRIGDPGVAGGILDHHRLARQQRDHPRLATVGQPMTTQRAARGPGPPLVGHQAASVGLLERAEAHQSDAQLAAQHLAGRVQRLPRAGCRAEPVLQPQQVGLAPCGRPEWRDLLDQNRHARDPAVRVAQGRPGLAPGAQDAGLPGGRARELDLAKLLPREHPGQHRLDLVGEARQHVPHPPADVVGRGEAVAGGQDVVDAEVTTLAIQRAEADRGARVQGRDLLGAGGGASLLQAQPRLGPCPLHRSPDPFGDILGQGDLGLGPGPRGGLADEEKRHRPITAAHRHAKESLRHPCRQERPEVVGRPGRHRRQVPAQAGRAELRSGGRPGQAATGFRRRPVRDRARGCRLLAGQLQPDMVGPQGATQHLGGGAQHGRRIGQMPHPVLEREEDGGAAFGTRGQRPSDLGHPTTRGRWQGLSGGFPRCLEGSPADTPSPFVAMLLGGLVPGAADLPTLSDLPTPGSATSRLVRRSRPKLRRRGP
nr:hypothetical protein [Rubellimicrobium mesophilum]